MHQLALKEYLLGPWLDDKDFPSHIKAKCREVMASHESYRRLYNPISGSVDTNWMFTWPTVGVEVVKFLDGILYATTPSEEHSLKNAVKLGKTPVETLTWQPWADIIDDLVTEIHRTATPVTVVVDDVEPGNAPRITLDQNGNRVEPQRECIPS